MTLIKTSVLSGISAIIKILSGVVITKVIAVYVGPAGLASIGNLQNFINIMLMVSGDFFKTATTKYTSQYQSEEEKRNSIWSTQLRVVIIINIVVFIFLMFFSGQISEHLFKTEEYGIILRILGISLPLFVLNTFFLSILNGFKNIKKFIFLSINTSLVSLLLVVILSVAFGLKGALVAYVTNQSVVLIITLISIRKESWFKLTNFTHKYNSEALKNLFGFALITFTAVLASNFSLMYIRNYITANISANAAGYWQGIWTLSQVSLTVITTALSTYFLPTIASTQLKSDITKEIGHAYKVVIPLSIAIAAVMYFTRDILIYLLYSKSFVPMRDLFLFQVFGNIVKIAGWLFGYVLVAKAMVRYTVATEVIFTTSFILLSMFFVSSYGVVGVTYAFAINNFIHFVTMAAIYKFKVE